MNSDVKADTSSWVDRCREHGDVLSWSLSDGRSETETVLGSAAAERGARIAHWLTQHTEPGDRIILALPDGPNLVVGMLACSHANVVSVPLKTDDIDRGEQLSPFVVYVLGHAAPTAVLTDSAHLDIFAANAGEHDYVAVAIADLLDEPELDAALPRDPDQTAMMLYSSGSTGTPKGVPHSHANLEAQIEASVVLWDTSAESSFVSWLPLSHSFGLLLGMLAPLAAGCPCLLMPPNTFVETPELWLRMLAKRRATHSGAPNFALDHVVRYGAHGLTASDSLASLRVIASAGEAVRRDTVERFNAAFAPFGLAESVITPHYGSTEMGPVCCEEPNEPTTWLTVEREALREARVEVREAGAEGTRALTCCGRERADIRFKVCDQDGLDLGQDRVGELWVSSPGGAQQYFQNRELTGRQFVLSDNSLWFKTGDQAVIHEDAMYIVGRFSDTIIVNAENYDPSNLELTLREYGGIDQELDVCVFSCEVNDMEKVIVAIEASADAEEEVRSALRKTCISLMSQKHGLSVHDVVLCAPGELRQGAGKLRRKGVVERYLDGLLGQEMSPAITALPTTVALLAETWATDNRPRQSSLGRTLLFGPADIAEPWLKEWSDRDAVDMADSLDDVTAILSKEKIDTVIDLRTLAGPWDAEAMTAAWQLLAELARMADEPPQVFLLASIDDDTSARFGEALIGFERSAGRVIPGWQVRAILVDAAAREADAWRRRVLDALDPAAGSSMVRADDVAVKQLDVPAEALTPLDAVTGRWLILGVTGGLGRTFASWLHEQGATVIGVGRRSSHEALPVLAQYGLDDVEYHSVDLSDPSMVKPLIEIVQSDGPLMGIVWSAGSGALPSLLDADLDEVRHGFRLRIDAAEQVAQLAIDVDRLVWCSSTAAFLGDFGSAEYAVGNRYLAALAEHAPGLAFAWPLWGEVGLGEEDRERANFLVAASGQDPLLPEEAMEIVAAVGATEATSLVVLKGEIERSAAAISRLAGSASDAATQRRADELNDGAETLDKQSVALDAMVSDEDSSAIENTDVPSVVNGGATDDVERVLMDALQDILRISAADIDVDVSLHDLGLDSLMLVELAGAISERLCVELMPDVFFNHPTIIDLARYLSSRIQPEATPGVSLDLAVTPEFAAAQETRSRLTRRSRGRANESGLTVVVSTPGNDTPAPEAPVVGDLPVSCENDQSDPARWPQNACGGASIPERPSVVLAGMSGVFPSGVGVDGLWSLVREGRLALRDVPAERVPWWGSAAGAVGGWLESVGWFDPLFFEIAPREAEVMDPRQRLLLEEMWHALEDAGVGPSVLEKERVGVFVGAERGDFADLIDGQGNVTSTNNAIMAGRLSYFLNLRGPVMSIDTACSSGLVAFHQAVRSLESGECDIAIVAAANIMCTAKELSELTDAGMVSLSGVCAAFGAEADGLVPGEAVVAVVLAREDVVSAHGLGRVARVLGSGVNCDGRTNGISAPSGQAQVELLRQVWSRSGVDPASLGLVVAHGTGTPLGDPIEVNALVEAFGSVDVGSCALVSVKPNVGHSLAASGLVGLVVLARALMAGEIPPSVCAEPLSSYVDWDSSPVFVNRELADWSGDVRRGGVSSFGFSGTNAHVVLERIVPAVEVAPVVSASVVLLLSAKSEASLHQRCADLATWLETEPTNLITAARTLAGARSHFALRVAVVASDTDSAVDTLRRAAEGEKGRGIVRGSVPQGHRRNQSLEHTAATLAAQAATSQDMEALGRLYCTGCDPTAWWPRSETPAALPGYAFDHADYWPTHTMVLGLGHEPRTYLVENQSSLSQARFSLVSFRIDDPAHLLAAVTEASCVALHTTDPIAIHDVAWWRGGATPDGDVSIECEADGTGLVWRLLCDEDTVADGRATAAGPLDQSPTAGLPTLQFTRGASTGEFSDFVQEILAGANAYLGQGVLVGIDRAVVPTDSAEATQARVTIVSATNVDIHFFDADGRVTGEITGLRCDRKAAAQTRGAIPMLDESVVLSWVEQQVQESLTGVLGLDEGHLDRQQTFATYGADSLNLPDLAREISRRLGVRLGPDALFSHPTFERLTFYLANRYSEKIRQAMPQLPQALTVDSGLVLARTEKLRARGSAARCSDVVLAGMSGVFPSGVGVDGLWSLVREGRLALRDVPAERVPWWGSAAGAVGGWLESVGWFDPLFFEIAPREAEVMDPRQRLLLEEMWHALEDAGVGPSVLEKERVGVFVGAESGTFDEIASDTRSMTALNDSLLAARLAYHLNLRGPVMSIDTACSSGLVAFHQAVRSLESGECDIAIAAAAAIFSSEEAYLAMSDAGMVSLSGVCAAFGAEADGLVPGEAVVAVVLAREDVVSAHGLGRVARVLGSGVNCDGRTNGISAPSGQAQVELLRQVWSRSGVDPASLGLVVAHGTGTPLGDPIEVNALVEAFGSVDVGSCALVSVKPNVGHSLAASGLVGLVVLARALMAGEIPPSVCAEPLSSYVDWDSSPVFVNRELADWSGDVRRGGVSSFGFSGTNAHVVLERIVPAVEVAPVVSASVVLLLSAKSEASLHQRCADLATWLETDGRDVALGAVAATLAHHRFHFRHRCAVVVPPGGDAVALLRAAAADDEASEVRRGEVPSTFAPNRVLNDTMISLWSEITTASTYVSADTACAITELYCQGYNPAPTGNDVPRLVGVPAYPFATDSYWPQAPSAPEQIPDETSGLRWIDITRA